MGVTRRKFTKVLLVGAAVAATGIWRYLREGGPRRTIQAVRSRLFPGKVVPLDEESVRTPADWAG